LVAAKLLPEPIRHGGCLFDADAVEGFRALFTHDVGLTKQKGGQPRRDPGCDGHHEGAASGEDRPSGKANGGGLSERGPKLG
jgi:hypothetical protein